MQNDKQPGLSWSTPKSATPAASEPAQASKTGPNGSISKPLFPSDKKTPNTQAPMYAGFLVAGIIIGALLATIWSSANEQREEAPSAPTSGTQAAVASSGDIAATKTTPTQQALVVSDQPAGPSVAVSQLNIARPTWVVVYVSREGKPGNALGARLFFASDRLGKVGLLRNTEAGQSYFVGLSVDNGDHAFSLSKDKPLADADGGPLWATFRAQ